MITSEEKCDNAMVDDSEYEILNVDFIREHLENLKIALASHSWLKVTVIETASTGSCYLHAVTPGVPGSDYHIRVRKSKGKSAHFYWQWGSPLGSVDDVENLAEKFAHVVKPSVI